MAREQARSQEPATARAEDARAVGFEADLFTWDVQ
jgi:hypothetical protein